MGRYRNVGVSQNEGANCGCPEKPVSGASNKYLGHPFERYVTCPCLLSAQAFLELLSEQDGRLAIACPPSPKALCCMTYTGRDKDLGRQRTPCRTLDSKGPSSKRSDDAVTQVCCFSVARSHSQQSCMQNGRFNREP